MIVQCTNENVSSRGNCKELLQIFSGMKEVIFYLYLFSFISFFSFLSLNAYLQEAQEKPTSRSSTLGPLDKNTLKKKKVKEGWNKGEIKRQEGIFICCHRDSISKWLCSLLYFL